MNHDSSSKINKRMKSDPKENRKDINTIKKKDKRKTVLLMNKFKNWPFEKNNSNKTSNKENNI